jgi:hypothetical protein
MSVEDDQEDQNENVDLVAGAWRRVGERRGGTREREPFWTGSRPSNDPSCDSRLELARPIQTPQNRRAELQPRCLRQLRLRWRRRWRRLEGRRRRLRRGKRNRWPLPPGPSWEFQVSPAPPASEALRGSPPWAFPPPDSRPWLHGRGLFSGHNVYYQVLAYFAEFARKVPEGALRSKLSGDERLYDGQS